MTCKDLRQTCDRLAIEEFNIISTIFQQTCDNLSTNLSISLQQTFRQTCDRLATDLRQTCEGTIQHHYNKQFNIITTNISTDL